MKFMITFTGKPAHFKDALSRFLKTGAGNRARASTCAVSLSPTIKNVAFTATSRTSACLNR